jgi:hypothetical protein
MPIAAINDVVCMLVSSTGGLFNLLLGRESRRKVYTRE